MLGSTHNLYLNILLSFIMLTERNYNIEPLRLWQRMSKVVQDLSAIHPVSIL